MLTKPAHAFSALQAVLMAASAGSFTHLTDEDFILDKRVIGGMQQVSLLQAAELGADVVLNSPVRTINWEPRDGERVTASPLFPSGATVNARFVIMAVPPNLYSRVSFNPPLPRRQHQMHQHQSLGLVIKVHAVYSTPFWREDGLSGTGFGAGSLVQEVYDNTNHGDTRGTLVGFISDEKADAVFELGAEERKRAVLESHRRLPGPEGPGAGGVLRIRLGLGGMDPRRLRLQLRPGRPAPLRQGPAHPGGPHLLVLIRPRRRRLPARGRRLRMGQSTAAASPRRQPATRRPAIPQRYGEAELADAAAAVG